MKEGLGLKKQKAETPQNLEISRKEKSLFSGEKTEEEIRELAPEYFAEKMKEKGMGVDHLAYIFINEGLPFSSQSFGQNYVRYGEEFFTRPDCNIKDLELLEKVINEFDIGKDEEKRIWISPPTSKNPFKDIRLN